MGHYQKQVQNMVHDGLLDIYLIIAVPRTTSTALEAAFSRNAKITGQCHEASDHLRKGVGDIDRMYKAIYEAAHGDEVWATDGDQNQSIIVKEMTQRFGGSGIVFRELLELTKVPPVFLIRNPLLSLESRARKAMQGLTLRYKEAMTTSWLPDYLDEIGTEYPPLGDAGIDAQKQLLDTFAHTNGELSWDEFLQRSLQSRDYRNIGKLLMAPDYFVLSASGWEDMEPQVDYLKKRKMDYTIVDSTELRAAPESVLRILCEKWRLPFSREMVRWGTQIEGMEGFSIGQDAPHQRIWYDSILASSEIKPPTETPPSVDAFPPEIREYLITSALPSYLKLSSDEHRVRIEGVLETAVPAEGSLSYGRRSSSGLIMANRSLSPRELSLATVDPIFAAGREPAILLQAGEFANVNRSYARILGIPPKSPEGDFRGRRR